MKKTVYFIYFFLLFLFIIPDEARSLNVKLLGNFNNSSLLFDNIIEENNYSEFKYKEGEGPSFILSLDNLKYIKNIAIYCIKGYSPQDIIIEFSSDLFTWKNIDPKLMIKDDKPNLVFIEAEGNNRIARFVKLTLKAFKGKDIRISELKISENDDLKVAKVDINVLKAEEHSIKFKLKTDIETMSFIKYGESLSALHDGPVIINYSTENVITLSELLKGTEYYIVCIAKDCNESIKYSSPVRVKTAGIPLPLIKRISTENIKNNSFKLLFDSNIPTKYDIYYGYSAKNMDKKSNLNLSDSHAVVFNNLKPESLIYYQVEIIDKSGNKKKSELQNIKTLPENIGIGSSISGDFQYVGENLNPSFQKDSVYRVVDNGFSYQDGSVMSGAIRFNDQKLVFNLKNSVLIQRADFIWWTGIYSTDFDLEISENGENWTVVKTGVSPDKELRYDFSVNIPYVVSRVEINKKARYIRAIFKKNRFISRFPQYANLRLLEVLIIPGSSQKGPITPELDK